MNLKKLEKAEAEADKIWKDTYGEPETEEPENKEPVETPPADTKPVDEEPPEPETRVPEPEPEKAVDWKHKYDTLEGKYHAEVPRLSQEMKQWRDNAVSLSKRVTELEALADSVNTSKVVGETDKELDALENDYPDIGKALKKLKESHKLELEEVKRSLQTGLSSEMENVKSDLSMSKQDKFDADMAKFGVPDWRELDKNPDFLNWLNEPAPYGRFSKLDLLQDAARVLDAQTVSRFFLEFKQKTAPVTEEPEVIDPQGRLNKFVAPPKNDMATKPKVGTKTLTREMYVEFMKDSAKGKFSPAKWGGKTEPQVEAMFDVAIASGDMK